MFSGAKRICDYEDASAAQHSVAAVVAGRRHIEKEAELRRSDALVRRGADAGNRTSMGHIGYLYYNGEGVSRDDREAAKWFMQSFKGSKARLSWAQERVPKWRSATLREVQRILREAGVYSGAIDGAYGPQTEAALEAYAALE